MSKRNPAGHEPSRFHVCGEILGRQVAQLNVIKLVAENVEVDEQEVSRAFVSRRTLPGRAFARDEAGVDPLAILLKMDRFDLGQAYELFLSLDPVFGAGRFEELGLLANCVLVKVEALFFNANEDGDDSLEVFNTAVDSCRVSLDLVPVR